MKYKVVCDTREKPQFRWTFPQDDFFGKTIFQKLDTGDYSLLGYENTIAIERKKSVGELAGNVTQTRFTKELLRLKEIEYTYLLLEFNLDDILSFPVNSGIPKKMWSKLRVGPKFILKHLSLYQEEYGLNIIYVGNTGASVAANIFREIIGGI